jgi:hypothetical protein
VGLVIDELGDAATQLFGNLVSAMVRNQLAQVGLEIERLDARRAIIEVLLDLGPHIRRQFIVEEMIEAVQNLSTIA